MQHGIITKHTLNIQDNKFKISGMLDPHDVKRYLLYWDQIIYPSVNGLGPNLSISPDLEYLENEGIIIVEEVEVSLDDVGSKNGMKPESEIVGIPMSLFPTVLVEAQSKIAKNRLDKGEIWTIGQTGDFIDLPSKNDESLSALEFTLYNSLPVPGKEVSFEDIINFRINNKNYLQTLQKNIESYRSKVASSDNPEREMVIARAELSDSINEVAALMNGKRWNFDFDTLASYIELAPNPITASILGAMGAAGINIPPLEGAIAGYAVSFGMGLAQRAIKGYNRVPEPLRDYVYLYNAADNKIVNI